MMGESDIDDFLCACLAGRMPAWPEAIDSSSMAQRVSYHGIAGLLLARAERMRGWPDDLRHAIRAEAHLQTLWEASHHRVLADLIERLAAGGIASLVLKGSALAYTLYADPAIRRRGDTDLLVRPGDQAAARLVLAQAGFARDEDRQLTQESWLRAAGDGFTHAIDLHWQVTGSPALNTALRVEDFFAATVALQRLSASARAPDAVSLFLHNCVNHAQHRQLGYLAGNTRVLSPYRLIWCQDVALQAAAFDAGDWLSLTERAQAAGLARLCLAELEQVAALLPLEIPPEARSVLASASEHTCVSRYLSEASAHARFVADLRAAEQLGDRLSLLGNHLFPARAHLQERFPDAAHWPLALLHLRRLAAMPWRIVTRR